MHDLVIRGGRIVDGSGRDAFTGDIAVADGRIVDVGKVSGRGRREIAADGRLVTPGWVDVHTHYDGQVTWDPQVSPSSWHGVTSIVMGNCGVGFAPVRPAEHDWLIRLMEGVEDIPGTALHEGMRYTWETFPEYMDALDAMPRVLDVAAQVPHHPLRVYVMGERGARDENATPDDVARMAELAKQGIAAGALGFTTSRTTAHRTSDGAFAPGMFAAPEELIAIGRAIGETGRGVFGINTEFDDEEADMDWMRRLARESGRPVWYLITQKDYNPDQWRRLLAMSHAAEADGMDIRGQVCGRPIGIMLGFEGSLHPFVSRPAYRAIAKLPLAERLVHLRDPAFRERLLSESVNHRDKRMRQIVGDFHKMFPLTDPPDYEPTYETSVAGIAERTGRPPQEVAYDHMLGGDGRDMLFMPLSNYSAGSHEPIREMLGDSRTLLGLGDGGAHCGFICDASLPTYMLTHWARDRTRGAQLPLEWLVHAQTRRNAEYYSLFDRGLIAPGMKADLNVIDFDRLALRAPHFVYDLPADGRRLVQKAEGYAATVVAGTVTFEEGEPTGALPGRLVRGARAASVA